MEGDGNVATSKERQQQLAPCCCCCCCGGGGGFAGRGWGRPTVVDDVSGMETHGEEMGLTGGWGAKVAKVARLIFARVEDLGGIWEGPGAWDYRAGRQMASVRRRSDLRFNNCSYFPPAFRKERKIAVLLRLFGRGIAKMHSRPGFLECRIDKQYVCGKRCSRGASYVKYRPSISFCRGGWEQKGSPPSLYWGVAAGERRRGGGEPRR
jgi:hypothetical protein